MEWTLDARDTVIAEVDQTLSMTFRRATTTLVLAMLVLGCGSPMLPGQPVALLTGDYQGMAASGACFTYWVEGPLTVDPEYGTAITDGDLATVPVPVMWRPGYTGRRVGSVVEVRDPAGNVVATTGRRYRIDGGYVDSDVLLHAEVIPPDPRAFFACGSVIPK